MKVILVEGIDNVGKTTLIKSLADIYKDKYFVSFIHCGAVPNFRKFARQLNEMEYNDWKRRKEDPTFKENLAIVDRGWTGEYVYGQIYRHRKVDDIIRMFWDCASILHKKFERNDFYEIFVFASPEFAYKHDDNMSLSSNLNHDDQLKRIQYEIDLFHEAMEINPLMLDNDHRKEINVEAAEYNFKTIDNILKELDLPKDL